GSSREPPASRLRRTSRRADFELETARLDEPLQQVLSLLLAAAKLGRPVLACPPLAVCAEVVRLGLEVFLLLDLETGVLRVGEVDGFPDDEIAVTVLEHAQAGEAVHDPLDAEDDLRAACDRTRPGDVVERELPRAVGHLRFADMRGQEECKLVPFAQSVEL